MAKDKQQKQDRPEASFIFVYRIDDRQRFLRIGKTPLWTLEAARERVKELRAVIDQVY